MRSEGQIVEAASIEAFDWNRGGFRPTVEKSRALVTRGRFHRQFKTQNVRLHSLLVQPAAFSTLF